MAAFILFEDESHYDLQPFTFSRPIYQLRSGIFTLLEKWQKSLPTEIYTSTAKHLKEIFGKLPQTGEEDYIWINGKFGPSPTLLDNIKEIDPDSFICNEAGEILIARTGKLEDSAPLSKENFLNKGLKEYQISYEGLAIRQLSDIFRLNREFIIRDFELAVKTETSSSIDDPYTRVYGKDNLFIGEGASVRSAIINAEDGPIYIGKQAKIQEGSIILNAHCIGENSTVSAGAKLRGDSSFGPWVKVGGEVGNSVIMGYTNKGHDGYLGNSVLGYWCNLGADSNTSNLKNNYSNIKVWHYPSNTYKDTGLQFHGLIMGDHSKCGINTMFNTGTVVGLSANIYGGNFPPKFIPSFAWGGSEGFQTYNLLKAFETATRVMKRRKVDLTVPDKKLMTHIFEQTRIFRNWGD
ncbi:MAG: glucose-1-phosphate thymidylyltransferase [Bacteroidia bacterium]|nr:glucose-1-phosphate thymidylyltransferase [Bacteroidia bacterium]